MRYLPSRISPITKLFSREPLGEFDARALGVRQEGDLEANGGHVAVGYFELDPIGFQLLAEGFEVFHLEADVVERAPFGRRLGLVGRTRVHFPAGNEGGEEIAAGSRARPECL